MRKMLVAAAALAIGIAGSGFSAYAGGGFSSKSFKGNYALVMLGTDDSLSGVCSAPPCTAALTGQVSSNGSGKISGGSVALNVGGVNCTGAVSNGSYAVNKDGTGTISLTITTNTACNTGSFPIGAFGLSVTLFNKGRQAALATNFTSPDGLVMSGTAASQKNIP